MTYEVIKKGDIDKLLKFWIDMLGLGNWTVACAIVRAEDMHEEDISGEVKLVFVSSEAIINLLDPVDWTNTTFKQDMEMSLVHELLHLKFKIIEKELKKTNLTDIQHQLLEDLAKALVSTYRSGQLDKGEDK